MEIIGIILLAFGGVFFFAGAFALALSSPDSENTGDRIADGITQGFWGLLRGFFLGFLAGIKGPRMSQFPQVVLTLFGATLVVVGILLR